MLPQSITYTLVEKEMGCGPVHDVRIVAAAVGEKTCLRP